MEPPRDTLRWVELRRHSLRGSDGNLTEAGRVLARAVCQFGGHAYRLGAASPKPRAQQTAQAFGVAEPETDPRLALIPGAVLAPFEDRIRAVVERRRRGPIDAWFSMPEVHPVLVEKGEAVLDAVIDLGRRLQPGERALAISHGSVIEPAVAVARGGDFDLEAMGGEFAECEGAAFGIGDDRIHVVQFLRRA